MDEFDAPRKMPVEHNDANCEVVKGLKEIEEQTCRLFEEFLFLEDEILDAPLPAGRFYGFANEQKEISDSPVFLKTKTRGFEQAESEEDDLVPDSAPAAALSSGDVFHSSGPGGDQKMKELAREIQKAGDSLVTQYGSKVKDVEGRLLQLVKQEAANLTYERFSIAVDDLVGKDKDWTTFVFAFCVGRRICKHSQEVYHYTKNYFQQYISQSYSQTLSDSGGVETFLRTRGSSMTQ